MAAVVADPVVEAEEAAGPAAAVAVAAVAADVPEEADKASFLS
jgi:hypothetical protein